MVGSQPPPSSFTTAFLEAGAKAVLLATGNAAAIPEDTTLERKQSGTPPRGSGGERGSGAGVGVGERGSGGGGGGEASGGPQPLARTVEDCDTLFGLGLEAGGARAKVLEDTATAVFREFYRGLFDENLTSVAAVGYCGAEHHQDVVQFDCYVKPFGV